MESAGGTVGWDEASQTVMLPIRAIIRLVTPVFCMRLRAPFMLYLAALPFCRRYSTGETPVCFLKALEK